MGVSAEVAQGMLRCAERSLGVDDPVVMEQDSEPGGEAGWPGERCEMTVELELAFSERGLEAGDELAAEDAAEHLDRKEEGAALRDPLGVTGCETAGGDHAVNVRMMLQSLVPGMEHAEEADLRAKVSRIACDLKQSGGTGSEQQAVNQPLVLERQRSQFARQREHGMDVARGQQFAFALLEPADACVALALRAVPVAARVIGEGGVATAGASIAVTAESGGAAARDRIEHLQVLSVDPAMTAFPEARPGVTDDVGHLQRSAAYTLRIASPGSASRSMSSGLEVALKCLLERCR